MPVTSDADRPGPPADADPAALARRYYDRIDADDYEAVFALFAGDITYHRPGQPPIEGLADLRTFYLDGRPLAEGEHVVESVVADGDHVAVRGWYVGQQDGHPVEFGWADFHTFEDGRIVERHTYTDRDEV